MFQIKYEYCVAGGGFVSAAPLGVRPDPRRDGGHGRRPELPQQFHDRLAVLVEVEHDLARLWVANLISENTAVGMARNPGILRDRAMLLRKSGVRPVGGLR